jgi:hypothetical protein
MTVTANATTRRSVRAALLSCGIGWEELCASAHEIVLFGSRAAGCPTEDSDWDLLCIGSGRTERRCSVDLVWIDTAGVYDDKWCGSELANHVAAYGQWITGQGEWATRVFISDAAVRRKQQQIRGHLTGLQRIWRLLASPYAAKRMVRLRREFQRWDLMRSRIAVPPTPSLDHLWLDPRYRTEVAEAIATAEPFRAFDGFLKSEFLPLLTGHGKGVRTEAADASRGSTRADARTE